VEVTGENHLASALEGRHVFEQFGAAIEDADAGWAAHLVPGKRQKIATYLLDVNGAVTRALGGVDEGSHAAFAGPLAEFGDRIDGPEGVGDMRHREQADIRRKPFVEAAQVKQSAVAVDGQKGKLGAHAFGKQLPRHDVAMVLHFGEQDLIAAADILLAPRRGNHVDAFGCAAGEDDFL
jgi:hypothetical protein